MISGVIIAQNRRIAFGFIDNTEHQIGLDQTIKGFWCVAGGLIGGNDRLKSANRRQGLAFRQIETPDFHFLARQLILDHVELEPGILGIF